MDLFARSKQDGHCHTGRQAAPHGTATSPLLLPLTILQTGRDSFLDLGMGSITNAHLPPGIFIMKLTQALLDLGHAVIALRVCISAGWLDNTHTTCLPPALQLYIAYAPGHLYAPPHTSLHTLPPPHAAHTTHIQDSPIHTHTHAHIYPALPSMPSGIHTQFTLCIAVGAMQRLSCMDHVAFSLCCARRGHWFTHTA